MVANDPRLFAQEAQGDLALAQNCEAGLSSKVVEGAMEVRSVLLLKVRLYQGKM